MKAKKRLTIATLIVTVLALVIALIVGKESNCIVYDISMAFLGSAALGCIMSALEYSVERRKAMEEFWAQARKVLINLRKIKYLNVDAPHDLIEAAFAEEHENEWRSLIGVQSDEYNPRHEAKDKIISWYEKNVPLSFTQSPDISTKLEESYSKTIDGYKKTYIQCIDSYLLASSIDLGHLSNAYGNLDFIIANCCIRKDAYDLIYDKIRKITFEVKKEAYHFSQLREGKGSLPVCASKVAALNQEYFSLTERTIDGHSYTAIYQNVFDDIDDALEKFRCKIYGVKYIPVERRPIIGKWHYFGEHIMHHT